MKLVQRGHHRVRRVPDPAGHDQLPGQVRVRCQGIERRLDQRVGSGRRNAALKRARTARRPARAGLAGVALPPVVAVALGLGVRRGQRRDVCGEVARWATSATSSTSTSGPNALLPGSVEPVRRRHDALSRCTQSMVARVPWMRRWLPPSCSIAVLARLDDPHPPRNHVAAAAPAGRAAAARLQPLLVVASGACARSSAASTGQPGGGPQPRARCCQLQRDWSPFLDDPDFMVAVPDASSPSSTRTWPTAPSTGSQQHHGERARRARWPTSAPSTGSTNRWASTRAAWACWPATTARPPRTWRCRSWPSGSSTATATSARPSTPTATRSTPTPTTTRPACRCCAWPAATGCR